MKSVAVDSSLVFIDPTILFMRLIVLVERSDSNIKYFDSDLTLYPLVLFKDYFMRHLVGSYPEASVLADILKTKQSHHKRKNWNLKDTDMNVEVETTNNEDQLLNKIIPLEGHVVIDGGALLHQVFWSGSTFKEVINKYHRHVSAKYKICKTVFEGYKSKATKNHEHVRREVYKPPCMDVLVDLNVNVVHSRKKY